METKTLNTLSQAQTDYQRIEKALHFIEQHFDKQPSLKEIADCVHLSEFHFDRLFSIWAGTSPQRFLKYLTKEYAKKMLHQSGDLLDTSMASGLSGTGRLHDLCVTYEAMTPGEIKLRGKGLEIIYGFHITPFGDCMIAITERGICKLVFLQNNQNKAVEELKMEWENAVFLENETITKVYVNSIFPEDIALPQKPLSLLLKGTNFQIKVWEALLRIPSGQLSYYEEIANSIQNPEAVRAVGTAIASNPIAYLIPCHRVIKKMGDFGEYRWGSIRKKAILGWEASKSASTS
jgi:AraC family transcriptional regulator of adaptative response/methylated-DNA-[protein]-cysteine methyltransferase